MATNNTTQKIAEWFDHEPISPFTNGKINNAYQIMILEANFNPNYSIFMHYPKILGSETKLNVTAVKVQMRHGLILANGKMIFVGKIKEMITLVNSVKGQTYEIKEFLKDQGFTIFKKEVNTAGKTVTSWNRPTPLSPTEIALRFEELMANTNPTSNNNEDEDDNDTQGFDDVPPTEESIDEKISKMTPQQLKDESDTIQDMINSED